jgi:acetyl esterase/lipase
MKILSRLLGYLSASLGILTLVRSESAKAYSVLMLPRGFAAALTPFLALAGGLGALIGLARRDRKATRVGLLGTAIAVRHIAKIAAQHGVFDRAFGADWRSRISPELQGRMLPKRWTPLRQDPPQVPWQQDVVFGTHVETDEPLLADVWHPPQDVPPTGLGIVFLHGSGWLYADKDFGTRYFFRHLAGQGHVIMDVAYTLAPKAGLYAMLADVKRAIVWMKENATEHSVDPERIVLMGGSAGAHLALLAAYTPNHPEFDPPDVRGDTSVRAVVSFYAPTDLESLYHQFRMLLGLTGDTWLEHKFMDSLESYFGFEILPQAEWLPTFLGGTPDTVPELYRLGSPINHIGPHCPPTLLLQGAHDLLVPDARRFYSALRKAGVKSLYVEFPDTEHGFDLMFPKWSPSAQAATYDTERFLALMV